MKSRSIELFSPLSPSECEGRLKAAIDIQPYAGFSKAGVFGTKPVVGSLAGETWALRKRLLYNNGFQSFLWARLRPEGDGTVVSGRFGMHPLMRLFAIVWLAISILGSAMLIYSATANPGEDWWKGVIIVPLMLVFGVLLAPVMRFLARNEPAFLTDFVMQTLDARKRD